MPIPFSLKVKSDCMKTLSRIVQSNFTLYKQINEVIYMNKPLVLFGRKLCVNFFYLDIDRIGDRIPYAVPVRALNRLIKAVADDF